MVFFAYYQLLAYTVFNRRICSTMNNGYDNERQVMGLAVVFVNNTSIDVFKARLKTHYFKLVLNV